MIRHDRLSIQAVLSCSIWCWWSFYFWSWGKKSCLGSDQGRTI